MLVELSMAEPDSETVVGVLLALLFTVRVPLRVPPTVGVKVTVTVQDPLTAMLEQLFVWLKSPVVETPETVAVLVPELVMVTDCAGAEEPTTVLPNVRLAGLAFSTGPGAVPVPDRLTVLVTPPALTVNVPVRDPAAVGLNVTLTVQEPFAAIDEPQLFVWAKSPVTEIPDTDAADPVGFDTVTVCAGLVEPVATDPKFSAVGETVTPLFGYGG